MTPTIPNRLTASPASTISRRPLDVEAIPRLSKLITKPKTVNAIPTQITLVSLSGASYSSAFSQALHFSKIATETPSSTIAADSNSIPPPAKNMASATNASINAMTP